MPQPTSNQVHVNAVLTNTSHAYLQSAENFIATQVFPIVNVTKKTDVYFTYTKADWFRDEAKLRAPGTESAGSGYGLSTDSYSCDVFALHKDVDDQTRANMDDPIRPDIEATEWLTQRMLVRQEVQFAADAFAASIWGTTVTGGTDFTAWSTYTTSDPVGDVETGKATILQNTGLMPNTLVLSYTVYKALRNHPDILERMLGGATAGQPAIVDAGFLGRVFGVQRVLVAMGVQDSAIEGETASMGFISGAHALLCYVAPNPGLLTPSAGYTFTWQGVSQGLGRNIGIKRFRMEHLASDRIEAQIAMDNKIVATDLGYFFASAAS